ncbi:hypothetical protein CDAR_273851 [Caerostris darwini]|uniref:Uncharacterized protein n=1 Tax=Caerostris darwini TaxID=1538125 RepID=A0AAV4RHT8_9ARAC|nr:hypothetical protein CDAR_273851 [Caerostris darwini]
MLVRSSNKCANDPSAFLAVANWPPPPKEKLPKFGTRKKNIQKKSRADGVRGRPGGGADGQAAGRGAHGVGGDSLRGKSAFSYRGKSQQPKTPAERTFVSSKVRPVLRARVPVPQKVGLPSCLKVDPPGLLEVTPRPRKVKRCLSFDSSEEEEVADDRKRRACLRLYWHQPPLSSNLFAELSVAQATGI